MSHDTRRQARSAPQVNLDAIRDYLMGEMARRGCECPAGPQIWLHRTGSDEVTVMLRHAPECPVEPLPAPPDAA